MRTIKFRAWDNVDNRMRYENDVDGIKEWPSLLAVGLHGLPISVDADSFRNDEIIGWNRDHNLVLMQFTGLTDKNGNEIYEGDITDDNIGFGFVEFSEGAYRVNFRNGTCKWFIDYLDSEKKTLEVIGNIYENPSSPNDLRLFQRSTNGDKNCEKKGRAKEMNEPKPQYTQGDRVVIFNPFVKNDGWVFDDMDAPRHATIKAVTFVERFGVFAYQLEESSGWHNEAWLQPDEYLPMIVRVDSEENRAERTAKVDRLLDEYNDYRELAQTFGDSEYDEKLTEVEAELKSLSTEKYEIK